MILILKLKESKVCFDEDDNYKKEVSAVKENYNICKS